MALSKIDVANMLTGVTPVANGGTAATTLAGAGLAKRPNKKPIIINGNMAVAQRGTSFADVANGAYTMDRFRTSVSDDGAITITQEALTSGNAYNDGFRTALKCDVTTADTSMTGNQKFWIQQILEAQDLQVLKYGTSSAEKITLAFWVKATKTGTNVVRLYAYDDDRSVSASYTVSSSDTWEHKVLNFPADTTGVIDNNNGQGIQISWALAAGADFQSGTLATSWGTNTVANDFVGQVNNFDSTSNNFHLTGIQLEVGEFTSSTLPPFQFESFGENLARCQRYFETTFEVGTAIGASTSTGIIRSGGNQGGRTSGRMGHGFTYPVPKRSAPTVVFYDNSGNSGALARIDQGSSTSSNKNATLAGGSHKSFEVTSTGDSTGDCMNYHFTADAEL
jgi:hypothetical protein